MARKCCIVTGSRAEYGLLYWLMREIQETPELDLQVAVTGMHLSPEFGLTVREIERDDFPIAARVEMLLSGDTPAAVAKSIGVGVIGFADAFARLQPDVAVVLGDRFEILAAAQAALIARIPLAHIHGGERTEGAIDEAIRHAVTKMSHLHFVAAEAYRRRVIQLGEAPERVFNVGAPGLDHMTRVDWLTRDQLQQSLDMPLGTPLLLVTYHPETLASMSAERSIDELLTALGRFHGASIIFTLPNADTNGRVIAARIEAFVANRPATCRIFASLGQQRYLSLMRTADVVIGNSSSGIIEAPALKRATVNIGERQRGRLRADSVIDCATDVAAITAAINRALSAEFRVGLVGTQSLYGDGNASSRIVRILRDADLDTLAVKEFHDL